jgi:hypothetical protein
MSAKWSFVSNNGGRFDGANATSEDHFKSSRLSSFVREMVQNSIDARPLDAGGKPKFPDKPVIIKIEFREINKQEFDGFEGIWKHIEASKEQAKKLKNNIWVDRYEEIIRKFRNRQKIRVLCVHDSNTSGLLGPVDGSPEGPLYAVTKGQGVSSKQNDSSGGSFGHGASAAFLFSGSRCVYYFSEIEPESSSDPRYRFMGKSHLQSHVCPYDSNLITVGTGYYANDNPLKTPLIDDEIPEWAKKLRSQSELGVGTSVYIVNSTYREDLYDETCISLIANFFNAFKENQLEAIVNNVRINKDNILDRYKEYKKKFEDDQRDEIDVDFIENCFKSIQTIVEPDEKNEIEIPDFGKVEWYLRFGEKVKWKKVGVSRSIGMLITREPRNLQHFQGMKNFDMFVCVKGHRGNQILKQIENPKHDAFELDRISDLNENERKRITKSYKDFTDKIRDIIKEYAKADLKEESIIDELADLFGQHSNDEKLPGASDRGTQIIITDKISVGKRAVGMSLRRGKKASSKSSKQKGDKKVKSPKPRVIVNERDKNIGFVAPDDNRVNLKLTNIRITSISENGKKAMLYFTNPANINNRPIILYKKGETDTEILTITGSNTYSGKKGERIGLELNFYEDVRDFVLEGAVNA